MLVCNYIERALRGMHRASHNTEQPASASTVPTTSAPAGVVDVITLDETDRHRRRYAMTSDGGIAFLLELETATLLRENDILRLNDGRGVRVIAKLEPLYAVYGGDMQHLLQLSWHVGNRHLPTQVMPDHLRIRRDQVIRKMLEQLGATVTDIEAGFDPEGGAYGEAGAGLAEHHEHTHAHTTGHSH